MFGIAGIVNWNNFEEETYIQKMRDAITQHSKTKVSIKGVFVNKQ